MANTAIVASNIVGIRLVRAISEALQSLDQRSALDRLLPCYHANVHGTFLLNSTCSSVVKTLHEQANIIKKSPLRDQRLWTPWACPVLGWGTTGEAHVLYSSSTYPSNHPPRPVCVASRSF